MLTEEGALIDDGEGRDTLRTITPLLSLKIILVQVVEVNIIHGTNRQQRKEVADHNQL